MATLISGASGNFTDAATWRLVETASLLDSQAANTALTTSPVASATFTPTANAVDGVAVKLASRATGTPTNTITVELYNNTTAAVAGTCTIDVADLEPASTTAANGGWYLFKFSGGSVTPNGTDSYTVRAYLNSTSTAVNLFRNATAGNWSRLLRRTATQAPAAGDLMHVMGEHTGSGTGNSFTVTMNSTTNTDYGDNNTTEATPVLSVNKRGTLAYGTSAATNYYLRLSGYLAVYAGGTFTMGTVGSEMPRDSTAVLEFDCGSDGAFGLSVFGRGTFTAQGLSRTSGKNVFFTKLTADLAASGTSVSVADDTGWKNGDVVAFAPTTRTSTQFETGTLSGDAGASSFTLSAGVTNAHRGDTTNLLQGHVMLLTRNVVLRGMSTSLNSFVKVLDDCTVDVDWVETRFMGCNQTERLGAFFIAQRVTGAVVSFSANYCVVRDSGARAYSLTSVAATATVSITNCGAYRVGVNTTGYCVFMTTSTNGAGVTLNNIVAIGAGSGTGFLLYLVAASLLPTATNLVATGYGVGLQVNSDNTQSIGATLSFSNWEVYSNSGFGFEFSTTLKLIGAVFDTMKSWFNSGVGLNLACSLSGARIKDYYAVGNSTANIQIGSSNATLPGLVFQNARLYGHSSFATQRAFYLLNSASQQWQNVRFEKGDFGGVGVNGTLVAHTTDIDINASNTLDKSHDLVFDYCSFGGTTVFSAPGDLRHVESWVRFQSYNRVAGDDRTYNYAGLVRRQTTVVDSGAALQMTPLRATLKLDSAAGLRGRGFLARVNNAQALTVSVKVRKDATYNGNAPRLILKANASIGYDADQVLDTHASAADVWETLSATLSAASADGVVECVVDCDGTAGSVFVDTWAAA